MADRMDLVGFDKHCLIRPRQEKKYQGKPDYKRQEQKKTCCKEAKKQSETYTGKRQNKNSIRKK